MIRRLDSIACRAGRQFRTGLTLVELVVALAISGLLMAGATTVLLIAVHTLEVRDSAVARTSETARLLEKISSDLRVALVISERTSTAITFTVPDRDEDATPETIRYEWLGSPSFQLTRMIDLSDTPGTPAADVLAEDVQFFDLSYLLRTWGESPPIPEVESDEVLLMYHDDRPDSGTQLLFVVTNAASPSTQEQDRKTLMETWGYTVTLITASDSQAAYDTAAASADVAYVSEEVNSGDVSDKLKTTTIGVVNEEVNLVDELGFATTFGFPPPGRVLDLAVSTHHLTSGFMPGPVTLFSTDQAITNLSNVPADQAPNIKILGDWGTDPALAYLEIGDELAGAGATEEPFGYTTVFSTEQNNVKQIQIATQVNLPKSGRLQSISLYSFKDKAARYAIYHDNGGEPGDLIVESAKINQVLGPDWNTFPVPETLLEAGTYWLAFCFNDAQQKYYREDTGGQTRYKYWNATRDGFLSSWGTSDNSYPYKISVYMNVITADIATGRRVQLPWGGNAFDINLLATDGQTLMKRSLEWAADVTPADTHTPYAVTQDDWVAQYFMPDLPGNAVGWEITRVFVAIKPHPDQLDQDFRFRLTAADGSQKPSASFMQETADIRANTWDPDRYTWYEIPFNATGDLPTNNGVCVVVLGKDGGSNASIKLDSGAANQTAYTHFIKSLDGGSTWSTPNNTDDMRFYVYGKYITLGAPTW